MRKATGGGEEAENRDIEGNCKAQGTVISRQRVVIPNNPVLSCCFFQAIVPRIDRDLLFFAPPL